MIRCDRGPKPQILTDNEVAWTGELMAHINAGSVPPDPVRLRYNHADIKAALRDETFGKCVYCEAQILHTQPGDIEHVTPKSIEPQLSFDWANLALACRNCNVNKGSYHNAALPLIDPNLEDPADHIKFIGPLIDRRTDRGEITIRRIQLDRPPLNARRVERLKEILERVSRIRVEANPEIRALLIDALGREGDADREYSACARAFVDHVVSNGLT